MSKFSQLSLKEYLDKLASHSPTPGGGSVSAYTAALAMGLIQMVCQITLKRKKKEGLSAEEEQQDDDRRKTIQEIHDSLEKTKQDSFQIVDLDPEVYQEVMDAWGKPDKMEDALENSFRLQADLTLMVVMAREWNHSLSGLVKGSIKNDLLVAAGMLEAAYKGAYHTAMINVVYMKDEQRRQRAESALEELKNRFKKGSVHVGEPK